MGYKQPTLSRLELATVTRLIAVAIGKMYAEDVTDAVDVRVWFRFLLVETCQPSSLVIVDAFRLREFSMNEPPMAEEVRHRVSEALLTCQEAQTLALAGIGTLEVGTSR